MQILGGVIMLSNLVLALVIGIRLFGRASNLRAQSEPKRWGPEAGLAIYFVLTAGISYAMSSVLYMGWADPDLVLRPEWEGPIHAAYLVFASAGFTGLAYFTWKTFRPDSAFAAGCAEGFSVLLFSAILGLGAVEGFRIRILPGFWYWVGFAARTAILGWLAFEALRYGALLRRRLSLGLADPLVTNRFMLWGGWAIAVSLMGFADPVARVWYVLATGSTSQWVPADGIHIVNVTVSITSALGMVTASTLFLTFFPTPGYRRWVETRAVRSDSERQSATAA